MGRGKGTILEGGGGEGTFKGPGGEEKNAMKHRPAGGGKTKRGGGEKKKKKKKRVGWEEFYTSSRSIGGEHRSALHWEGETKSPS